MLDHLGLEHLVQHRLQQLLGATVTQNQSLAQIFKLCRSYTTYGTRLEDDSTPVPD